MELNLPFTFDEIGCHRGLHIVDLSEPEPVETFDSVVECAHVSNPVIRDFVRRYRSALKETYEEMPFSAYREAVAVRALGSLKPDEKTLQSALSYLRNDSSQQIIYLADESTTLSLGTDDGTIDGFASVQAYDGKSLISDCERASPNQYRWKTSAANRLNGLGRVVRDFAEAHSGPTGTEYAHDSGLICALVHRGYRSVSHDMAELSELCAMQQRINPRVQLQFDVDIAMKKLKPYLVDDI